MIDKRLDWRGAAARGELTRHITREICQIQAPDMPPIGQILQIRQAVRQEKRQADEG